MKKQKNEIIHQNNQILTKKHSEISVLYMKNRVSHMKITENISKTGKWLAKMPT